MQQANIVKDKCIGHCTPGLSDARYHYHMSPECAWSVDNTDGVFYTDTPGKHSPQLGWEFDGFGLFGHQDEGYDEIAGTACTVSCHDQDRCDDTCEGDYQCHCGAGAWTGMNFCRTSGDTGAPCASSLRLLTPHGLRLKTASLTFWIDCDLPYLRVHNLVDRIRKSNGGRDLQGSGLWKELSS